MLGDAILFDHVFFLGALALAAACKSGISESRFDSWNARIDSSITQASAAKEDCMATAAELEREHCIEAWDAVLHALIAARVAGALAYLVQDEASLQRIEQTVDQLLSQAVELPPQASEGAGSSLETARLAER